MRHIVIIMDLWLSPGQEQRYRETREIPPEDDVRAHVVHELGELVEGAGALDDLWDSQVRGRPEEA
ncbi:hypothetical protein NE857_31665 [Nocardiopsis exhalans]|uniref:Uncharacterized protein n=1 Tax=Nocardiopsis exhalans TaxID=163604 RepID=A0ABY5D9A9_9ACTN|nr:hypothetical protein [Nocardiopsis exhalans]USY19737.1 hypothetical protein NE857_31665 [Nocardiopsis exhalans]